MGPTRTTRRIRRGFLRLLLEAYFVGCNTNMTWFKTVNIEHIVIPSVCTLMRKRSRYKTANPFTLVSQSWWRVLQGCDYSSWGHISLKFHWTGSSADVGRLFLWRAAWESTHVLPGQKGVILCQCGNDVLYVWLMSKINETGKRCTPFYSSQNCQKILWSLDILENINNGMQIGESHP